MAGIPHPYDKRLAENLQNVIALAGLDLSQLYPEGLENRAICPICWQSFDVSQNPLTNEHVPPKNTGRHLFVTRTCTKCNNDSGSTLENHYAKHISYSDVIRGVPYSSFRARITADNLESLNAKIFVDEKGAIKGNIVSNENSPSSFQRMQELDVIGMQMNLEVVGSINESFAKIAILKSAYLTAFHYFGYGYLFSKARPVLFSITEQIRNPDEHVLPDFGIFPIPDGSSIDTISVVNSPDDLQGLLIVLPMRLPPASGDRIGVLLPSAMKTNDDLYSHSAAVVGTKRAITYVSAKELPNFNEYPWLAHELCKSHRIDHG